MEPFLHQVAAFLDQTFKDELSKVCVVLPNRRAGLYLRKHLAACLKGRISWSPDICSIEDFFARLADLQEVDQAGQLLLLYDGYKELEGDQARPFENFLEWAPQVLSDFNDVDQNAADPHEVFQALSEARAINVWNPDGKPLTTFQREYLRFFQSLLPLYEGFTKKMAARNVATKGIIFRSVTENIGELSAEMPWKHIVFAGFNALTRSEEIVINELRNQGRATLLWDCDAYYLEDRLQEAGTFIRQWIGKWPVREVRWVNRNFEEGTRKIHAAGFPDPITQARHCGSIVREISTDPKALEKCVIVLMDMSQMFPVLHSLPSETGHINVTVGYPLRQTSLAAFILDIITIQVNSVKFNESSARREPEFHYSDILLILNNPYMHLLLKAQNEASSDWLTITIQQIRQGSKAFYSRNEIIGNQPELFINHHQLFDALFMRWTSYSTAYQNLVFIVEFIYSALALLNQHESRGKSDGNPELIYETDMQFALTIRQIINQLDHVLLSTEKQISLQAWYMLLKQAIQGHSVPLAGEPLQGLQLMGMLETRALDFENVIILSCNEGFLPSDRSNTSFIPFDIRQALGLSTFHHQDAIQAYHFYRLLQRAQNVWLLYLTETKQLGAGEKSRYLLQLGQELCKRFPNNEYREQIYTNPLPKSDQENLIEVAKTENVMILLENKAKSGFSASSINTYRWCGLKFYYAELARIREPEELQDTMDAALLGQTVHEAVFNIYKPLKNNILNERALNNLFSQVDQATSLAFGKRVRGGDLLTGKNHLLFKVATNLVRKVIRYDIEKARKPGAKEVSVVYLEQEMETDLSVQLKNNLLSVKLKGVLDRVEKVGSDWYIIDYKSGTADKKNVTLTDWELLKSDTQLNMAFQLLFYGYLLWKYEKASVSARAGLLPLKKMAQGLLELNISQDDNNNANQIISQDTLVQFEDTLNQILTDIFNPELPFVQTENRENCKNCPYINLCGR